MKKRRNWSVTVEIDGDLVLSISSQNLAGVKNVSDYEDEIEEAARNLLAFIGRDGVT